MAATNNTIATLYKELKELEAKLQEINPSYSVDDCLEEFNCGITYLPILDPVIAADEITYEKAFITKWFKEHDTSPTSGAILENKVLIGNTDFRKRVINQLEKEKQSVISILATAKEAAKEELPLDSPEMKRDEPSSAALPSQVDSEPVLTPISEEIPPPVALASTFFSPVASHSGSHSSSSVSSPAQTISLTENDVWQRCLELRNLIGILADPTNIAARFIVDAVEAKHQYVNLISYVEEQIERTGEMTSAEIELIRRALVPMTEYEISISNGRVIESGDILQLSFEISEFSAEVEQDVEVPVVAAPIAEDLPPPLTVSSPVLHPEAEFPLIRPAPSLSSSLLSSFYGEPDEAQVVHLTEADVWQRCLELRNLLALPADSKPKKPGFFNANEVKEKYVKIISFVEEKKRQGNGVLVQADAELISNSLRDMAHLISISTADGRFIHPEDISRLWMHIYDLCAASSEQREEYTELMERRAKLEHLEKRVELYGAKYALLLKNIRDLRDAIIDKIDEYKMKHPSLATTPLPVPEVDQDITKALAFWALPPLAMLMKRLREQIFAEGQGHLANKSSHIYSAHYEQSVKDNKFRSQPFSPCSWEDEKVSSGGAALLSSMSDLFNADKIHTSKTGIAQLQAELKMVGIPARIETVNGCRFKHGDSTVSGVRIVFDCDDPEIFNVALALQEIRYQHNPQSVVAHLVKNEPTIIHHSLLSPSSDLDLPNPNSSLSRFGRNR